MGTKAIDPQSIRNVTIIGHPTDTARLAQRLLHGSGTTSLRWATDRVEHTIRVAELSSHAPMADLERSIRVADGLIAVVNAANSTPRLDTMLSVADDHQVARLCVITSLDHPAADFDRCIRTIAETRGAVPLPLHIPLGTGPDFDGSIDLIPMWSLEELAAEFFGPHWIVAEHWYRTLIDTVLDQTPAGPLRDIPPAQLHRRIRTLTRIGEVVPVLCGAAPGSDDPTPLLDAIVRYLPSPLDVCQPEHALDY
ncbi:GTP-binding protein [Nocardia sp. NPDC051030]|uniref:GTP-binding protein n=1 Tax=Nocardia sp. NPDC051030 TaxID=3155162 RepID=UPI00341B097F